MNDVKELVLAIEEITRSLPEDDKNRPMLVNAAGKINPEGTYNELAAHNSEFADIYKNINKVGGAPYLLMQELYDKRLPEKLIKITDEEMSLARHLKPQLKQGQALELYTKYIIAYPTISKLIPKEIDDLIITNANKGYSPEGFGKPDVEVHKQLCSELGLKDGKEMDMRNLLQQMQGPGSLRGLPQGYLENLGKQMRLQQLNQSLADQITAAA